MVGENIKTAGIYSEFLYLSHGLGHETGRKHMTVKENAKEPNLSAQHAASNE